MPYVQIISGPMIQEGESLSQGVDCSDGKIVRITMPDGWDTAPLTFQISTNGEHYNDLYYANGEEYVVAADEKRAIIIDQEDWIPGLWVKIRSGLSAAPKTQVAYREFSMVLLCEGDLLPPVEDEGLISKSTPDRRTNEYPPNEVPSAPDRRS